MKLTGTHRDQLLHLILGDRYKKSREALDVRQHNLAQQVYRQLLHEYLERPELERFLATPPAWLPQVSLVSLLLSNGRSEQINLKESRVVPQFLRNGLYSGQTRPLKDDAFLHELRTIQAERASLLADEDTNKAQIKAILASATTTGKLKKIWPEIADQIETVEVCGPRKHTNLPVAAAEIKRLNTVLELPKT